MPIIDIPADRRTPLVRLSRSDNRLLLEGESYPEDVTAFYGPLLEALTAHLDTRPPEFTLDFRLVYFNSSSAKVLMMIIDQIEEAAADGTKGHILWSYDPEDEVMQELGEDFGEDVTHAKFEMHPAGAG